MSAIENIPEIDDTDSWQEEDHGPEVTPWNIRNSLDAAEAMRRARYFQSQLDELTAIKLAQIDQIDRWYAKEVAKVAPKLDRYRVPLERFSDEIEASLSYPAGKMVRRKGSEVVEILDPDALITFAEGHPAMRSILVRVPEPLPVPAKDEMKKAEKAGKLVRNKDGELVDPESGEVLPARIIRNDPTFKIEFSEVEA